MTTLRLVTLGDAPELATILTENRDNYNRSIPTQPDEYYSVAGQQAHLDTKLREFNEGRALPCVILDEGRVVGSIGLSGIEGGGMSCAVLGYSVAAAAAGRGHATAAVGRMVEIAFTKLGLHRLDAGAVVSNLASQRVLHRNGFTRLCVAPGYVLVAGSWRDAVLYQRLTSNDMGGTGQPARVTSFAAPCD